MITEEQQGAMLCIMNKHQLCCSRV